MASITNALRYIGASFAVSSTPSDVDAATRVILPGVGSFGAGMRELRNRQLVEPIRRLALRPDCRLFGICLGMQLLFESSDEAPGETGLGLLAGKVCRLEPQADADVPHVGFDEVHFEQPCYVMDGLRDGTDFYFTHSYAVENAPSSEWVARCMHGSKSFVAAVASGGVAGAQFHPEKSQSNGLTLLRNVVA
jgi:imidazole glycerol phosphate synthase glutamine amidotransferase subunit